MAGLTVKVKVSLVRNCGKHCDSIAWAMPDEEYNNPKLMTPLLRNSLRTCGEAMVKNMGGAESCPDCSIITRFYNKLVMPWTQ